MSKNHVQPFEDSISIAFINSTGAAIKSGALVRVGPMWGVAQVDIAASATGAVLYRGRFKLPKSTGVGTGAALPVNAVAYYDTTNRVISVTPQGEPVGIITVAPGDSDATVEIELNAQPRKMVFSRNPTNGEAVAGTVTLTTTATTLPISTLFTKRASNGAVTRPTSESWALTGGVAVATVAFAAVNVADQVTVEMIV